MAQFDLVIRNALLYDGSGAAPRAGDLALEGGRIAALGSVAGEARRTLDAKGLALAPGFIDVHTHDDFAVIKHPGMAFKVLGGVTTCIIGNCGFGPAPYREAWRMAAGFQSAGEVAGWENHQGYLARLERDAPSVNVAMLIGHGTVRLASMAEPKNPAPSGAELAKMKALVQEGIDAGAVGMSTGLVYEPGRNAATEEIVELAKLMAGTGALYATHMRDESLGLLDSVDEAVAIGERAGVPVQISHHKASGRKAWGMVDQSLARIDAAQRRGLDVHADQYPYTAGSTILSAVVADGRFGGGLGTLTADDVVIAAAKGHADWEGKSIAQLAREMQLEPLATAHRILEAVPGTTAVLHAMNEDDVRTVMRHPSTMIGSDGIPALDGRPHPRLYGTFARVLGRYARDLGLFSIEEAVYRMTGFPAAKFGFKDRGLLREGFAADLVLFDPKTVIDVGTYEDPKHAPKGIAQVFVNGIPVVEDARHTGARPGRVLRRAG
ncbi:MAG: D-aminoacylase [Betaproteobacteria bacterium]|nr:D-aminoacylase [Betaproteobacteria bacterium]